LDLANLKEDRNRFSPNGRIREDVDAIQNIKKTN
jgi:hypothetical protein